MISIWSELKHDTENEKQTVSGGDGPRAEREERATDRTTRVDPAAPRRDLRWQLPSNSNSTRRLRDRLSALPEAHIWSAVHIRGHLRGQLRLRPCSIDTSLPPNGFPRGEGIR